MRSLFRFTRLIALAVPLISCTVPQADAANPVADSVVTLSVADVTAPVVTAPDLVTTDTPTQATRPADALLLAEAQVSLRALSWRTTDGKFRATNRENGQGPWEADIRDALWKGLFYVTQPPSPTAANR